MKHINTDLDRRQFLRHCALGAAAAVYLGRTVHAAAAVTKPPRTLDNPFFAYAFQECNFKNPLPDPEVMLDRLGYAGTATKDFDILPKLATYREKGLRVFATWFMCDLSKEPPKAMWENAIPKLAGSDVLLWPILGDGSKSLTEDQQFASALKYTNTLCDLAAAAGLKVALYPHGGSVYCPEKARDAVRLVEKAARPNLGLTLNLAHEGSQRLTKEGDAIIAEAMPHLYLVTINGAPGILSLGEGEFDVYGLFVKKLRLAGYNGPIGLQTWGVKREEIESRLAKSIKTWREYQARFAVEQKEK